MKRSISERFLYIKENDDLFAIPVRQSISFQSPMFGATYKTKETADKKRLFQIQVFETKRSTKCLAKIDEENDRQVNIINEITKDELYGIVYDHVEKIIARADQTCGTSLVGSVCGQNGTLPTGTRAKSLGVSPGGSRCRGRGSRLQRPASIRRR